MGGLLKGFVHCSMCFSDDEIVCAEAKSLLQIKRDYEKVNRLANWFDDFEKLVREMLF